MRILTTGVASGLGRYLWERLGGIGWSRGFSLDQRDELRRTGVDVIIHCAFNASRAVAMDTLYTYLDDNVLLTAELTAIPHHKFIFLSSVDVYPTGLPRCSENEPIPLDSPKSLYAVTKLLSEAIVRARCQTFLILRCVSVLGPHSRKNTLIRIIEEDPCTVGLSADSRLNYVLHSDVAGVIQGAASNDLQGIYNVASSEPVSLSRVAQLVGKPVVFGGHTYDVGNVDNAKIAALFPAFRKTAEEVVLEFIRQRGMMK